MCQIIQKKRLHKNERQQNQNNILKKNHSNLFRKVVRVFSLLNNKQDFPKYILKSINKLKDHWRLFDIILYR